ncbi:MAG: DUF2470 domain-containing protein [Bacteroidota bacterium]
MSQEVINNAQELYNSRSFGLLSTISVKLDGYPFGSVVPYCLDAMGNAVILISTIAQHTKNLIADPRCSLTILKENNDVQAHSRLCIIGDMQKLPNEDNAVIDRYYRHFPQSAGYHEAHDFSFYRLQPASVRYIGGFGNIHWLAPKDFQTENPFDGKSEQYIVDHMNDDHQKDLISYCKHYFQFEPHPDQIRMVGIDAHGFDVFAGDRKVRFTFPQPVYTAQEARMALVEMSQISKAQ